MEAIKLVKKVRDGITLTFKCVGITAGGVMLTLTAIVLTVGMFTDVDGSLWSCALILYLAYLGGKTLYHKWNTPIDNQTDKEVTSYHEL